MKTRHAFPGSCTVLLVSAAFGFAQNTAPLGNPPSAPPAQATAPAQPDVKLSAAQVDDLTGSIALYPDPLIAQILPAATFPTDIVLAARMVARGASTQELESQEWDPSVKAVAHYPSIIKMMDERLEWTQQLGAAFVRQPDDVMDSVQRLRTRARALGHLQDTPQQKVIVEEAEPQTTVVRIVPASPEVVYVPTYEPEVVYVQPYTASYIASPYIWFGAGFAVGSWLNLDCDWYARRCYYPVGWSWYGSYPSWGFSFGWYSGYPYYYGGYGNYWHGAGYPYYYGYGGHYYDHHDSSHHGHYDPWSHGRTDDAHVRSWSRDDSRPAPHLRTSQTPSSWAERTSVPGYRRSAENRPVAGDTAGRAGRVPDMNAAPVADTTRRAQSPDAYRRTLSPDQVRDRLSRSAPTSRSTPPSVRTDTAPRVSDRTVPNVGPKATTPNSSDALKRTRQLPPTTTGRTINRGNTGGSGPLVVPGSNDPTSRGRGTSVRTVTPGSRSVAPSTRSTAPRTISPAPSTGRSGPSVRPSSGGMSPRMSSPGPSSRQAAPRSSPAPSRSAPAPGGSAPGNRRSR